ncbi:restriction endonuclease [Holotrichia oblita]|uniref:Restriction endonuclease n=1 Tax=Holotrichia oblita TaxID=644536 RepID=A0ACB9SNS6_HOLOL|nr:restriction endonuclease [Holotrichia oblita]
MTNNAAEHYNSVVAKFVVGNRINYSRRRQFGTRAEALGIPYNSGGDYYNVLHKEIVNTSLREALKNFINQLKHRRGYCSKINSKRKLLFKDKRQLASPDDHYGSASTAFVADMTPEQYAKNEQVFLIKLKKNAGEIKKIEEATRRQAGNPIWFEERANRITAYSFKAICSLQKKTSCVNTVKKLFYSRFTGNVSTRYARQNEFRAVREFES